jgi:hypothetical protein
MAPALIGTQDHIKKYNKVDHYAREYVKSVKSCYKEKEIGKKSTTILVMNKVGPFNDLYGILLQFKQGFFS